MNYFSKYQTFQGGFEATENIRLSKSTNREYTRVEQSRTERVAVKYDCAVFVGGCIEYGVGTQTRCSYRTEVSSCVVSRDAIARDITLVILRRYTFTQNT